MKPFLQIKVICIQIWYLHFWFFFEIFNILFLFLYLPDCLAFIFYSRISFFVQSFWDFASCNSKLKRFFSELQSVIISVLKINHRIQIFSFFIYPIRLNSIIFVFLICYIFFLLVFKPLRTAIDFVFVGLSRIYFVLFCCYINFYFSRIHFVKFFVFCFFFKKKLNFCFIHSIISSQNIFFVCMKFYLCILSHWLLYSEYVGRPLYDMIQFID